MTVEGFIIWSLFFAGVFLLMALVEGLCIAAAKPMPSPFDRIADYSASGTACENCPDLDACEDDECPHDWMDWGLE
jgi:hypothetical protein